MNNTLNQMKKVFIEILGELPDGWEVTKNKYAFLKVDNGKNNSKDTQVLTLTTDGIKVKEDLTFGKTSKTYIGHQLVNKGDIVFTPRDFDQTPILSSVSNFVGCISNLYIVDKANDDFDPQFINYYWYGLKYKFDFFKNFSYGMRHSFNRYQFDDLPLLKPTLEEQIRIVNFLDMKLKNIDTIINNLKQKKELIIEGIQNHSFELKNRKVNLEQKNDLWFQFIPEDWKIVKFKEIFEPISLKNNSTSERLLSVTQEQGVIFRDEQIKNVVNPEGDTSSYKLVSPGNFIISLRSADGGFEVSNIKGLVSPAYTVLKTKKDIDINFYRYLFKSKNFVIEINRYIKGIRDGKNIYFDDIKNIQIPFFPEGNRTKNYKAVIKQHENLHQSLKKYDYKIELLNEYKKSLISSYALGYKQIKIS
jgi:type I restriction enzyme, S subunit